MLRLPGRHLPSRSPHARTAPRSAVPHHRLARARAVRVGREPPVDPRRIRALRPRAHVHAEPPRRRRRARRERGNVHRQGLPPGGGGDRRGNRDPRSERPVRRALREHALGLGPGLPDERHRAVAADRGRPGRVRLPGRLSGLRHRREARREERAHRATAWRLRRRPAEELGRAGDARAERRQLRLL